MSRRRDRPPSSPDRGSESPRAGDAGASPALADLTTADFSCPDAALMQAYPCAYDATTSTGLGPLQRALADWSMALQLGRATLPAPVSSTTLASLLRYGTGRCFPITAPALAAAKKRRRSLAQFKGLADDLALGDIDLDRLRDLDRAYRLAKPERPGAQVTSDLTELRLLVTESRTLAGLAPLNGAKNPSGAGGRWPASEPHNPRRPRHVTTLEDVQATMRVALTMVRPRRRGGPPFRSRWVGGYLALQVALPLQPGRVMALRRGEIVGSRVVITDADGVPVQRFGLPTWVLQTLNASVPGWRTLPATALLFPGRVDAPRTDLLRVLGILVLHGGPVGVTPLSVRRLSQGIHRQMGAPRGVIRATLPSPGTQCDEMLLAGDGYATKVVAEWATMTEPPIREPATVPKRAPVGCPPSKREFDPFAGTEPVAELPASILDATIPAAGAGSKRSNRAPDQPPWDEDVDYRTHRPAVPLDYGEVTWRPPKEGPKGRGR